MKPLNWDELSRLGNLQAVIDPHDSKGAKNYLIDRIQWNSFRKHLNHSKNVLDFGCGIGRYAQRIAALGIAYTGIDSSVGMINKAKELHGSDGFVFKHFDGINIPFDSSSFDTVILSEVLTYFLKTPTANQTLSEINRVLSAQGRLILIEQASISGRKSESASEILTENDYVQALSAYFKVNQLYKVRSPDFSKLTCKILESPKVPLPLFRLISGQIAKHESALVAKADDNYFQKTSYYEFMIDAQPVKPNGTKQL